jgi:hypothetical protein
MSDPTHPLDWTLRERLTARAARFRCECTIFHSPTLDHFHGEERCRLHGDNAQPRVDRDDFRIPAMWWLCQPCARSMYPDRFNTAPPTVALQLPHPPPATSRGRRRHRKD